jgi:predicted alpha-1,2-mannosidase
MRRRTHPHVGCCALVATALVVASCSSAKNADRSSRAVRAVTDLVAAPAALVNPFMGTGVGGAAVGNIDTSPAADVPFGMMQWGPDTTPHRADGGGYHFGDTATSGFSLTHLNGPGCAGLGDVPILPTVGALSDPEHATAQFTHAGEHAGPGHYSVALTDPRVDVELATTTRTGIARFTYPAGAAANVLFKVGDSAVAATRASVRIVGDDEVTGTVVSGEFCDTPGTYQLSFDARFNRPFRTVATWNGARVAEGGRAAAGTLPGASVSFAPSADRTVQMKVGISFVDLAGARANLDAEDPGWDIGRVERAATDRWNATLGRIRVGGGTTAAQQTFYSAMYRSLLHPNVFDDVNGAYPGLDGRTHIARGYTQYTNFSGWDIYRSEMPLLAMVEPGSTSDMMRSLLADYDQSGRLPKWPFTDVETGEMNGDAADAIIADADAFGADHFDARAALVAMVKGATTPGTSPGWDVERQDLDEYLRQGWVEQDRRDKTSFDYTIGGSETLEYAIDDYAIATVAGSLGDTNTATTFLTRAANWRHLFNPATGYLAARGADGSFPSGPPFQPSKQADIGQDGWEEGNSIQYTWSVPQDLHGLFALMGGNRVAVQRLDTFFTHLNTSRHEPYDWAGNEPALGIPWEYDYAGAPWRAQDVVRRIATTLYAATPNGEPGNDDLGAMSSWYVWAAIGMYPETPGRADMALASPMFSHVDITLGSPGASTTNRYVQHLSVAHAVLPSACGRAADDACPWLPASALRNGAELRFTLGPTPDRSWGSDPRAAPPSMTR